MKDTWRISLLIAAAPFPLGSAFGVLSKPRRSLAPVAAKPPPNAIDDDDDDVEWTSVDIAELIAAEQENDEEEEEDEWLPDRERAKQRRENARIYAERIIQNGKDVDAAQKKQETAQEKTPPPRRSAYTDEEEEVIAAMGGKTPHGKREPGFLGDSTLEEIATDYSMPICYVADVLTMWGVPAPIHPQDRLADLVTGEQAFSLLEAANSLDVSALHDRYSNTNLVNLCSEWEIDLQQAFEMAMREGWSLPFGVQTCLRVEQEDALLRELGSTMAMARDGIDDEDEY